MPCRLLGVKAPSWIKGNAEQGGHLRLIGHFGVSARTHREVLVNRLDGRHARASERLSLTRASDLRKVDRLSLQHWQAVLEAGVSDAALMGLPEPGLAYLKACLLHGDAAQWQAYGNGWSLRSGDEWHKRAKEFLPVGADATLLDSQVLETARLLARVEAREQGAPLILPSARDLLDSWVDDYSKFGLLSAGNELLNEIAGALGAWLSAVLSRKPWPSLAALQKLAEVSGAHARWLGSNPLTAMCYPFGSVVRLLIKAGGQLPAEVTGAFAG